MEMREDSELFLKKALEYQQITGENAFELNIDYFKDIPNINASFIIFTTSIISSAFSFSKPDKFSIISFIILSNSLTDTPLFCIAFIVELLYNFIV